MKEHIVVVGGYGHVGQTICKELGEFVPGKVFAAGRNRERAEQFSRATGGMVRPLSLNITETVDPSVLDSVKLVVMCVDQTDPSFVRSCMEKGVHYVDISANHSFLSRVERLHKEASASRATAVLSVGLAPGLTNLLARHAHSQMDQTDAIDISVMLGLGDQHGKAAIEWTIDNLNTEYEVVKGGDRTWVKSFTDGKETFFGAEWGRKKAYRFNFSDQHALPQTLDVPSVSTRLCFDSAAVTGLLAWLRALGAVRLLKWRPIRNAAVQLFGKMRVGTERFAVKIDAWGKKNQQDVFVECLVQGKNEAEVTAKVAAAVAASVTRSSFPHGVYHMEQLFELQDIWPSIHGVVSVETRVNGNRIS
ncbi:saccharopine dehydrogenase family protein [Desmospora profundinema]|uniref:Saccharopine dehydrogenase-like NADP-dependent oxidoreductase n=1 Tax=Desmospora profundinema TaxID=1571184 RepID=A0ABU1IMW4_9BACL|nr:saccharopine dehydrogenase NADP-binding domain-containing protein [Desmospora profundinema]MDR6226088.1 saccharopine dehydrogenase-like NADP-dependent oxidoreductase [Desmospora profundinema]